MIAIFLPSALLALFFYPIWHNLKRFAVMFRALEGVNAAVVGIMIAATFIMMKDVSINEWDMLSAFNLAIILLTFLLLRYTRFPSPLIVLICMVLGWIF